jgi:uncharacterized membrane protein
VKLASRIGLAVLGIALVCACFASTTAASAICLVTIAAVAIDMRAVPRRPRRATLRVNMRDR